MPRPPSRYLHPIDDAWRARVIARLSDLGWTLSELSRRLERQGITVSRSALRLTLQTQQAGSKFKAEIERELGLTDSTAIEKRATSSENATASHSDPVGPSVHVSPGTYDELLREVARLRDDQVPTVLALIRAMRARR